MASLNKVMLIGNLTRDPEVRFTPKGSAVCDLGLAVNRRYLNEATGERVDEVTYLDVVVWGKQAELAGQYLSKGRSVYVEGRLQMDSWEDKATGTKRTKIKIVAENLLFLDSKGGGGNTGGGGYAGGDDEGHSAPPQQQRRPAGGGGGGYSGGGGGSGGGYQQRAAAPQQRPQPQQRPAPAQQQEDDFGEGPITDGMEGDDIPF